MTYCGPGQLAESTRSVRRHTITIAEGIPEDSYDYRPAPDSRSVREIWLHIAPMTQFDLRVHAEERLDSMEGFDFRSFFSALPIHEKLPASKADILIFLRDEGERWCYFVEQLPERVAAEPVQSARGAKTRSKCSLARRSMRCITGRNSW